MSKGRWKRRKRAGGITTSELLLRLLGFSDDVLDAYGRQTVTLEKLEDGSFIVRF